MDRATPETVIYWILDEVNYFSTTDEVTTNGYFDSNREQFHIPGTVEMLSKERMHSLFSIILPLLKIGGGIPVILIMPYKRWIEDKCCNSPSHGINTATKEWEKTVEDRISEATRTMRSLLFSKGLRHVRVINPCSIGKDLPNYEIWEPGNDILPANRFFDEVADSILVVNSPSDSIVANNSSMKRPREDSGESGSTHTQQRASNHPPPLMAMRGCRGGNSSRGFRGGRTRRPGYRGRRPQ